MSILANLFNRDAGPSDKSPVDRVLSVERAIDAERAKRVRNVSERQEAQAGIAACDTERSALALRARADGDRDAQHALDATNDRKRRLEDTVDDLDESITGLDARLAALDVELREAERGRLLDCTTKLCATQVERGIEIDRKLAALVHEIQAWTAEGVLIVDHGRQLDVPAGRDMASRLQDAFGILHTSLPAPLRQHAWELRITATTAARGATFASMSQIHGPIGELIRPTAKTGTEA